MIKYKRIYAEAFDLGEQDFPASEISGGRAQDIHHIVNREGRIENLMAVTRKEHDDYGDRPIYMPMLLKIHRKQLDLRGIKYENEWFEKWISYYEALTS